MIKAKRLTGGKTHTVESFWNASGTAFFRAPAGTRINVKYGKGWFSRNTQKQTLDGQSIKRLKIGKGAIAYARMRVKVPQTTDLTYDVYPGGVSVTTPEVPF